MKTEHESAACWIVQAESHTICFTVSRAATNTSNTMQTSDSWHVAQVHVVQVRAWIRGVQFFLTSSLQVCCGWGETYASQLKLGRCCFSSLACACPASVCTRDPSMRCMQQACRCHRIIARNVSPGFVSTCLLRACIPCRLYCTLVRNRTICSASARMHS